MQRWIRYRGWRTTPAADAAQADDVIRAIVFDMDGTLTVPKIDFHKMRSRVGVPAGQDILATVAMLGPEERARALAAIDDVEREAMLAMELQPGYHDLMEYLHTHNVPRALLTRNQQAAVDHLVRVSGTSFVAMLTRDFEPVKPSPLPLLHICERALGLPPSAVLMVGDHLDDLQCGIAAGTATALLRNPLNAHYASQADIVVDRLADLIPILEGGFACQR